MTRIPFLHHDYSKNVAMIIIEGARNMPLTVWSKFWLSRIWFSNINNIVRDFFLDFSRFKRFWKKSQKTLKSSVYFYSFLNANSKLCRPHFGASWSWFAHTTSKYEKPANLQQSWTWDFLLMLWIWLTRHSAV